MLKRPVLASILTLCAVAAFAAGAFDAGEALYRQNRPSEAAPYLEKAILEPGADERAWLYLANCYQMLGKLDEAAAVLRKGLPFAIRLKPAFFCNLGNVFVLQGRNSFAVDSYGQAIEVDGSFAPAFLQRANSRLSLKDIAGASEDYKRYIELVPGDPQRGKIEELLARLASAVSAAQQAAAAAEAQRLAAEAAKKALLDQLAAALKAAADETTSLSAGTGTVQGYGDELKIDE